MVSSNFLHHSDVVNNIRNNRPFLWSNDYQAVAIALGGGAAAYILASSFCFFTGVELACVGSYENFFIERFVNVICSHVSESVIPTVIFVLGTCGTFGYSIFRDIKTLENEKVALNFLGEENRIISQSEYKKLLKNNCAISNDLDKRYEVPDESWLGRIREVDRYILKQLFEEIIKSEIDQVSIVSELEYVFLFKNALARLTEAPAMNIQIFLGNKLSVENFKKILSFAEMNDLDYLRSKCKKFFKEKTLNISL